MLTALYLEAEPKHLDFGAPGRDTVESAELHLSFYKTPFDLVFNNLFHIECR